MAHQKISYIADKDLFNYWLWPVTFANSWAADNAIGSNSYWAKWWELQEFTALGQTIITGTDSDYPQPYMWMHIEDGNTRIQGVVLYRQNSDSDNVRIIQRNGVDFKASILAAIGAKEGTVISEDNLVGVAWLPCADRLNS